VLGTKGAVRILTEVVPTVLVRNRKPGQPSGVTDEWQPLPGDPVTGLTPEQRSFGPANRRLLDDWLDAITRDREPQCSGTNAMKAVEMVMAVYEAALKQKRVKLPLETRAHPLA